MGPRTTGSSSLDKLRYLSLSTLVTLKDSGKTGLLYCINTETGTFLGREQKQIAVKVQESWFLGFVITAQWLPKVNLARPGCCASPDLRLSSLLPTAPWEPLWTWTLPSTCQVNRLLSQLPPRGPPLSLTLIRASQNAMY